MTCDRCGAGIAMVHAVDFKDGSRQVFGTDCIEKILSGDTSLQSLYRRQVKNLARCKRAVEALQLGDAAALGQEYYGAGMFFVADSTGASVTGDRGQSFWHPKVDAEKNLAGTNYRLDGRLILKGGRWVNNTPEQFTLQAREDMTRALGYFNAEVAKIESFLGRIVAKGLVTPEKAA